MADLCVNTIMQISHHYSIASPLQSTLGTNNLMGPSGTPPLGIVEIFASINIKTMTAKGKTLTSTILTVNSSELSKFVHL